MSANKNASDSERESMLLRQGLAFLHQAREVRSLGPAQVERIERRLKRRTIRSRRAVLLPAVAALGLILVAGAAFAVAKGGLRSLPVVGPLLGPLFAPNDSGEAKKPVKRRALAVPKPAVDHLPAVNPTTVTPAPTPVPATTPIPEPAKASEGTAPPIRPVAQRPRTLALRDLEDPRDGTRATRASESRAAPAGADRAEDPIVAESHSFASVIEPWHRTHNADATLALLDAHERRYPSGHLRLESRVLRAEIYLSQGRENDSLAVLDSLSLSGMPRARELRTVRGELRIKVGRCAEGKRDLGEVLEKSVADALAKRAVQAMSRCP
jgi:hypothetical protein